jgi:hypothetical protein
MQGLSVEGKALLQRLDPKDRPSRHLQCQQIEGIGPLIPWRAWRRCLHRLSCVRSGGRRKLTAPMLCTKNGSPSISATSIAWRPSRLQRSGARVAFALMKNQTDYEPRIPCAQT